MLERNPVEHWRPIPDFPGYEVSTLGHVRRFKNGQYKSIAVSRKLTARRHQHIVRLYKDGKRKEKILYGLMASAFLEPPPSDDLIICHKNGCTSDNRIENIGYIDKRELGRRTGSYGRRRTVVKIGPDLQDVDIFASASEASRASFMSRMTICERCNGKVKKGPAPDGYEYAWYDSKLSRRRAVERMKTALEKQKREAK